MWTDLDRSARDANVPWQPGPPANFPMTRTSEECAR
jgi:hypothetical protein